MIILGIESSCDETAAAVVRDGTEVLSSVISSQINTHKEWGGVVPEIASRLHIEAISRVIDTALKEAGVTMDEIDAIGVTQGPGLIGSLHVGVTAAKALAFAFEKPLIPVNHLAGHIYAGMLDAELKFPLIALLVSGGNSELVYMKDPWSFEILGETQDDAIGEAYDKVSRLLELGYPGGPVIDRLARQGEAVYPLRQPKTEGEFDFSFSGLKSSVLQLLKRLEKQGIEPKPEDIAASFQKTALDEVFDRVTRALDRYDVRQLVVGGGVSANSELRKRVEELKERYPQMEFIVPPLSATTDNAVMIAVAAHMADQKGRRGDEGLVANASMELM